MHSSPEELQQGFFSLRSIDARGKFAKILFLSLKKVAPPFVRRSKFIFEFLMTCSDVNMQIFRFFSCSYGSALFRVTPSQ